MDSKFLLKFSRTILVYWFALTVIPGIIGNTNSMLEILGVSFGFAVLMSTVSFLSDFLKFKSTAYFARAIIRTIMTFVYTFLLKPGILGIIFFPKVLDTSTQEFSAPKFGQFGIILTVAFFASILINIFDYKEK